MLKKTGFIVGVSLIVQAVSFLVLFVILIAKKKSIAWAFLTLAAAGGTAGGFLVYKQVAKELENSAVIDAIDSLADFNTPDVKKVPIPVDDTVDDKEFE